MNRILKRFMIEEYNIGFIKKTPTSLLEHGLCRGDIIWMEHPYKDRFFADPFLLKEDDQNYYIVCEEYVFWEKKGKIALLTIDKERLCLQRKKVLIEEPVHLSFPFCTNGGSTVIPEAYRLGAVYRYTVDTDKLCVTEKEKIASAGIIDPVLLNENVLFGSDVSSSELREYRRTDGEFREISGSPRKTDATCSRPAGRFFTCGDRLYRPAQNCRDRYGESVAIMRVTACGGEYSEETEADLSSRENPPFDRTMHTFNVYDGVIIVDGSRDALRILRKPLYWTRYFILHRKNQR